MPYNCTKAFSGMTKLKTGECSLTTAHEAASQYAEQNLAVRRLSDSERRLSSRNSQLLHKACTDWTLSQPEKEPSCQAASHPSIPNHRDTV